MKFEDLKQQLVRDLPPIARLASPTKQFTRLLLISVALVLIALILLGDLATIKSKLNFSFVLQLFVLSSLAVASGLLSFQLSIPGCLVRKSLLLVPTGLIILWSITLLGSHAPATEFLEDPEMHCGMFIAAATLLLTPLIFGMLLKAAPLEPVKTGVCAGLFCTSIGAITLLFVCPREGFHHLMQWHLLPVVAIPLLGIVIYKKLFRSTTSL